MMENVQKHNICGYVFVQPARCQLTRVRYKVTKEFKILSNDKNNIMVLRDSKSI
jgi:hypothetical protein